MDVLSNTYRRQMLLALADANPQEDRKTVSSASEGRDDEGESAIAMQHVHLPKLEDCGFIRWNREKQRVTKGPQFDEIEPLLTVVKQLQDGAIEELTD